MGDVDIEKILVSNKILFGEKSYKYFIAHLYNGNKVKPLTLFRMGFLGAAHGWGGGEGKKAPLPKICHTHTMMKLGTIIPCLKKSQKIHESRDTPLVLC